MSGETAEVDRAELRRVLLAHHVIERQLHERISDLESALRLVYSIAERHRMADICAVIEGTDCWDKVRNADPTGI